MNKFLAFVLSLLFVTVSLAQNTRSTDVPKSPLPVYQSTKKDKKGFLGLSNNKKNTLKSNEVANFRKRLQDVHKEKAKEQKLADKKRYKDPSYFGHKKKPKKRPPGKQKFCTVCRIKH